MTEKVQKSFDINVKNCGCKGCAVSREEGRQQILSNLADLVFKYGKGIGMEIIPTAMIDDFIKKNSNG